MIFRVAYAAVMMLTMTASAFGDCLDDSREVKLDGDNVVRLKGYLCRTGDGPNDATVKVEFFRLSDVAADMAAGGTPPSPLFTSSIGTPTAVKNQVFQRYFELLKRFGETYVLKDEIEVFTFMPGIRGLRSEQIPGGRARTILEHPDWSIDYPDADDIQSLRTRVVPQGIKFLYAINCADDDEDLAPATQTACRRYSKTDYQHLFWRGMRADHFEKYSANLNTYNRLLRGARGAHTNGTGLLQLSIKNGPKYLSFVQNILANTWPDDFLILFGELSKDLCEPNKGLYHWNFRFYPRMAFLDTALITNISRQAANVEGLIGSEINGIGVRPIHDAPAAGTSTIALGPMLLAPGQSLLVPIRIAFPAPEQVKRRIRYQREGREIHAAVGNRGYRGGGGYGLPSVKDYAYGAEIAVRGLQVNGKPIDLATQAANPMKMTVSTGAGSCPYLLSWSKDEGWLNHGKALHKAAGKDRQYTETTEIAGFRSRFRLEEREPELAFIDEAVLQVVLRDGATMSLKPDEASLIASDGDYMQLYWGEAVEFSFVLPDHVKEADVVTSRLLLTGYYERYSAQQASLPALFDRSTGRSLRASNVRSEATCPLPTAKPTKYPSLISGSFQTVND